MADRTLCTFARRLRGAVSRAPSATRADAELLARFAEARDEQAFAELVGRYGRLVWKVCRNVVADGHDAEEATQATFLLLARRAGSLRRPEALAGWLYGVAYRTALRARRDALRRRAREAGYQPAPSTPPSGPVAEASWRELQAILDEELRRLPERLRAPFALCCLEGYGHAEAAQLLGCKTGTLSGRLDEARKLLRRRLARRGVSLSPVLYGLTVVCGDGRAGLPAAFAADVVAAAVRHANGEAVASGGLARAVLREAFWGRVKVVALVAAVLGVLAAGVGVSLRMPDAGAAEGPSPQARPAATPKAAARPRVDRFGDALPGDAVARLGTKRFGHSWWTDSTVWSPDGKTLASLGGYSSARRVCLWDVATGRELHDLASEGNVPSAAFSPDGKTLLVAEDQGGAALWDVASGKLLQRFADHGAVVAVGFAPNGRSFAAAGRDGIIRIRDAASGRSAAEMNMGDKLPRSVVFAPDGKSLASTGARGDVILWDLASAGQRWCDKAVGAWPWGLAFSPDGKTLATGGAAGSVRIYDAASGKNLLSLRVGRDDGLSSVAWSPDGRDLATAGPGDAVCLWDAATGKEKSRWPTGEVRVSSASFSPDGRTVATGGIWGSRVRLWDAATGKELHPAAGHNGAVFGLSFSCDGKTAWSAGRDRAVVSWDVASAAGKRLESAKLDEQFSPVAFTRDGRTFATGGVDGRILLFDGDGNAVGTLTGHGKPVQGLGFSPDGKLLASSGADEKVRLWDVTGLLERNLPEQPGGTWGSLVFSEDGRKLALSRSVADVPRVVDAATGKELFRLTSLQPEVVVVFSPDGGTLATSGSYRDKLVRLWDAAAGTPLGQFGTGNKPGGSSVRFSPDGRLLAAGGFERDDAVHLWEVATFQEVATLRGHHSSVQSLAFTPDGRTLASGGGDATVLIWDLTGQTAAGNRGRQPLSPNGLGECWKDIAGDDARAAYRAVRGLATDPARSVPFLAAKLRPAESVDVARMTRLLADLDADAFETRSRAEAELEKLGEEARPTLRKLCEKPSSEEARRRAEGILEKLDAAPEWRRQRRAVAALEYAAAPEARRALEALAKLKTRLGEEARAALSRLTRLNGAPLAQPRK
jgi:RNA polymerase sigma factor (sigma-70 family)